MSDQTTKETREVVGRKNDGTLIWATRTTTSNSKMSITIVTRDNA